MPVVVGTPDVDDLVKAPDGKLVAVIGNIGGKVGVEPVGTAEHVVLQVQLFDFRLFFSGFTEIVRQNLSRFQPQRPVLFIGKARIKQLVYCVCDVAGLMPGSVLFDEGHDCTCGDNLTAAHADTDWRVCLEHGEKLGIGTREYELIKI